MCSSCPRYIMSGDTHSLCVLCLGVMHAESALEGLAVLIVSGYYCVRFAPGGFSSRREPSPGFLAVLDPFCVFFPSESGLSTSPIFLWGGNFEESADYSPIQSPQYEELLEVVTRVVWTSKLISQANQTEPQKSKLDERFLHTKSLPQ